LCQLSIAARVAASAGVVFAIANGLGQFNRAVLVSFDQDIQGADETPVPLARTAIAFQIRDRPFRNRDHSFFPGDGLRIE
jgi:hypothetical protein